MNDILVFAFLFFIGCVAGWGIEVLFRKFLSRNNPDHRWINPGFLAGPWLPLYGVGLCSMYCVSELLEDVLTSSRVLNTIIILLLMTLVMTIIELIAGLIFTKKAHIWLWDYRNEKLNFMGVICPKFSFFWGVLGCFYYFVINPYVLDGIIWLSQHLTFSFFIGAFFGVFTVDFVYSNRMISRIKAFADEKQIVVRYEELKAHMSRRREELNERKRFFFAFHSELPLRKHLEDYADKIRADLENIKQ